MARARVRAAVRKAAAAVESRQLDEADEVAVGVRRVAKEIAPLVKAGSLYWVAPVQFVCEQMAVRVCAAHGIDERRRDDVAGYLLAGLNEYIVSFVGDFDAEHFESWTVAAREVEAG